jgi:hypothetical protein
MDRLDPLVRRRVYTALNQLASNDPRIHERKLEALGDWRIRVGDTPYELLRSPPGHCGPPCTLKGTGRGSLLACCIRDNGAGIISVTRVLPRGRAYDR